MDLPRIDPVDDRKHAPVAARERTVTSRPLQPGADRHDVQGRAWDRRRPRRGGPHAADLFDLQDVPRGARRQPSSRHLVRGKAGDRQDAPRQSDGRGSRRSFLLRIRAGVPEHVVRDDRIQDPGFLQGVEEGGSQRGWRDRFHRGDRRGRHLSGARSRGRTGERRANTADGRFRLGRDGQRAVDPTPVVRRAALLGEGPQLDEGRRQPLPPCYASVEEEEAGLQQRADHRCYQPRRFTRFGPLAAGPLRPDPLLRPPVSGRAPRPRRLLPRAPRSRPGDGSRRPQERAGLDDARLYACHARTRSG